MLQRPVDSAELISFRVSHDDPVDIPLPDVDSGRGELFETTHLSVLIPRPKVEVKSILAGLRLANREHRQPALRTVLRGEQVAATRTGPNVLQI